MAMLLVTCEFGVLGVHPAKPSGGSGGMCGDVFFAVIAIRVRGRLHWICGVFSNLVSQP